METSKKILDFLVNYFKNKLTDTKKSSRKYKLIFFTLIIATLMCVLPPILSDFVFKTDETLFILSGTQWVTIVTTLIAFYYTSNVVQKKITGPHYPIPGETEIPPEKPKE